MRVYETPKHWAFVGRYQTPEGAIGWATGYVKKATFAKYAAHYGWGVDAKPTDVAHEDGTTLGEILFTQDMISKIVWG